MKTATDPYQLPLPPLPPPPPPAKPPLPAPVDGRVVDPRIRVINGRQILRVLDRAGNPIWREIVSNKPRAHHKTVYAGNPAEIQWDDQPSIIQEWVGNPAAVIDGLLETSQPTEFDPRPASPIHDELERAKAAGYEVLVQEFHARNLVKPRVELTGMPLGRVLIGRGVNKLSLSRETLLAYLQRHQAGDWGAVGKASDVGELSDDQVWCPPLFGTAVSNQAAVKAGKGLVRSVFPDTYVKTRGPEDLKIVTWIGQTTLMCAPSHGDVC